MKKNILYLIIIFAVVVIIAACRRVEIEPTATPIPPARSTPTPTQYYEGTPTNKPVFADITDFESGNNAYIAGFANYRKEEAQKQELTSEIMNIPDLSSKGFFMSGYNRANSLLMYISKSIIALPNTRYTVQINFDIATNSKSQIDNQSTSKETIYIKSGVSNTPFQLILDEKDYFRSNWDMGYLDASGSQGKTLGAAEKVNSMDDMYQYKSFSHSFSILTADDGLICVVIAAESNIPDYSSLYFDNIIIEISEQ